MTSSSFPVICSLMVHVWDAANGGNVVIYHGHTDYVNSVAWSPDGKWITSGSDGRTVLVWKAP